LTGNADAVRVDNHGQTVGPDSDLYADYHYDPFK